jgi:hypothetical protein
MCIFDYFLRVFVCATPSNIENLVEEASGGNAEEVFLDVVLCSLLHSNDELVKEIGNYTRPSACLNFEEKERNKNDKAIITMANTLLNKTSKDEAAPHLEDDILRLAILSSIGWSTSIEEGPISIHRDKIMNTCIQPVHKKMNRRAVSIDLYTASIFRALCVFLGGMGEALLMIANPQVETVHVHEWTLPPGCIYMCSCAVRGSTRWILHSFNVPRLSSSMPRKIDGLENLIPVLLNSVFRLEKGLVKYAQVIGGSIASNEKDKLKLLQTVTPQSLPLFDMCNDCASMIMKKISSKEGSHTLDFFEFLDTDCQKWFRSKTPVL